MPENIIDSVLKGKLTYEVLAKWLNDEAVEDTPEYCDLLCCSKSEFVTYFLSFLRNQTDSILQTNRTAFNLVQHQSTPEKLFSSRRKHRRSISEPNSELETDHTSDSLSVQTDRQRSHESPSRDSSNPKKSGRRVKTKLFNENENSRDQSSSFLSSKTDSDESRLSVGVDRLILSSTPLKNGTKANDYPNLPLTSPVTPHSRSFGSFERCDTPRVNHRHSKSHEKSNFGDFLASASTGKNSKKKRATSKNYSNEAETVNKGCLDFGSSEMYPEIGARKSSSLRSEKRRIKPTNIDSSTPQKSFSLNSFNSEAFQQPSLLALEENLAFKHQNFQPKELANSFNAERSILKQERHKLMEKFNILNTSNTPKAQMTPQIQITRRDSTANQLKYVKADFSKVKLKEKIDLLVEIYDLLLRNNLILSTISEIYFLISILLSQQHEDDYLNVESNLNDENNQYILKSIHNSTYFSVKSLWHQRHILEFMLDKNSLKILGENKKVRSFFPELAKFLLNLYGIKSESESNAKDKVIVLEKRFTNGMVCFNFETDNAENFPSLLSFQNFKKQRDMFYEILRWYTESQQTGTARSTFRTRVKTLLSLAVSPANNAHLARLLTAHMLSECLPSSQQESKLSKLQRRLTGPAGHESHLLSRFTSKEMFYKEFIMFAENESFRVHLRDSLSSEICVLDAAAIGSAEDRGNSNPDATKEYLQLIKKLRLLSKFLGFLSALPYTQVPIEYTIKTGSLNCMAQKDTNFVVPKEKVLENDLAMRNHSQPTIDLITILIEANKNCRLCITIPWVVQYLSMLDYTTLRIKYYQELLKTLFEIYVQKLKVSNECIKRNTIIFLKLSLGLLCDLPQFPQELFYEKVTTEFKMAASVASDENLDSLEVIDESILNEVCPFLKDINVLLLTSKPSQEVKDVGSFRHITPVTMSLNPEDRIRNKEKEIQARLEEEFLKGQPSSTRRVIEVITERVTSSCVKHVCTACIRDARRECTKSVAELLKRSTGTEVDLLPSVREIYSAQLIKLRATALDVATRLVAQRASMALQALVACGSSKKALTAVVSRACVNRISKWLQDHWDSTDVLCKDISGEMKNILVLGDSHLNEEQKVASNIDNMRVPVDVFERVNVSPTTALVEIKEQICLLLEYEEPTDLARILTNCMFACRRDNLFTRAPAQRALLHLTFDLCLVYVSRKPSEITEPFLNQLHQVWNECCPDRKKHRPPELELPERRLELSPEFRNFDSEERISTPISDEETDTNDADSGQTVINSENQKITDNPIVIIPNHNVITGNPNIISGNPNVIIVNSTPIMPSNIVIANANPGSSNSILKSPVTPNMEAKDDGSELLEYFERVLCPRNIALLSASTCKPSEVWEAMATVLVFMLKNDYLNEDSLTEQCLAVYRQDWPQNILENLSICMKSVSARWRTSAGKFTLFLDFLAEFCGDMDFESFDLG